MQALQPTLQHALATQGPLIFLTGAGISAESHIPTFRGEEGYWRAESRLYQPQELATRAAFARLPELVWSWYLWRWAVCNAALPNAAHLAIARAGCLPGRDGRAMDARSAGGAGGCDTGGRMTRPGSSLDGVQARLS
jgi:hypothetical protein